MRGREQRPEDSGQRTAAREQKTARQTPGTAALWPLPAGLSLAWLFVAVGVLLAPIFAHGCHGDDVDHEPVLLPLKWLEDE